VKSMNMRRIGLCVLLILFWTAAGPGPGMTADILDYLPASGEVQGWSMEGEPESFQGENLFMMINGGADLYHEYGFKQVTRAEYLGPEGKVVKLEIYQMQSPAAAYGIYTLKAGEGGKAIEIGQAARLQDYYLNFWKGSLLVTLVGLDSDEQTMQGLTALARAVEAGIGQTGERPRLASLLLSGPLALSNAKYVRGPLGVMSGYIFDTKNIFQVSEGMLGAAGDCRVFVFQYKNADESLHIYQNAAASLKSSTRFSGQAFMENQASMMDRDHNMVLINQLDRYIAIVIGQDQEKVKSTWERLAGKLKNN
jgi:hypothetical protein